MSKSALYDRFLMFRAVIVQAIAIAWHDPAFRERYRKDPRKVMKEELNYDIPFNIDVKSNPNNAKWEPRKNADWVVRTRDAVIMVLPPPPEDRNEHIIALAEYNRKHLTFLGS